MALEEVLIPKHQHTGVDAPQVEFTDLATRKHVVHWTIYGADAATAGNYGVFFTAPWPCFVTYFSEVHQTAGSDAGAVTLDLEKLTGTQAPDAGVSVLSSTLSLKGTANTVTAGTLTATIANRRLAKHERFALKDAGVLTAVANVTVMIEVQY